MPAILSTAQAGKKHNKDTKTSENAMKLPIFPTEMF